VNSSAQPAISVKQQLRPAGTAPLRCGGQLRLVRYLVDDPQCHEDFHDLGDIG